MKVRDVMTREVWSIGFDRTGHDALALMWEHDIGALPVVDHNGQVVGMITDRDVAMSTFLRERPPSGVTIAGAMSQDVVSCAQEDTVNAAERLMADHQVRRLPVVGAKGEIVGIVTLSDLARAANSGVWRSAATGIARTLEAVAHARTG